MIGLDHVIAARQNLFEQEAWLLCLPPSDAKTNSLVRARAAILELTRFLKERGAE